MEEQLETALSVIRAKKTELMMEDMKSLQERVRLVLNLVFNCYQSHIVG